MPTLFTARTVLLLALLVVDIASPWRSSIVLSDINLAFVPIDESIQFLVEQPSPSIPACASYCFSDPNCGAFNYHRQTGVCRLYEGEPDVTGFLLPSLHLLSGSVQLVPEHFVDYGQSCEACHHSRSLICVNQSCVCRSHMYYSGRMCQNQRLLDGSCTSDDHCRADLGLTCASNHRCTRE
jgi:hypothetical protein